MDVTIVLQEQDRLNLEKLLLLSIQETNYHKIGHELTIEQESLQKSYIKTYEALQEVVKG